MTWTWRLLAALCRRLFALVKVLCGSIAVIAVVAAVTIAAYLRAIVLICGGADLLDLVHNYNRRRSARKAGDV